MIVGSILFSLACVLGVYFLVSLAEKNYINVLTPHLLFSVPAFYLMELLYIVLFGPSGSAFAYFYCYLTYAAGVLATGLAYLAFPSVVLPLFVRLPSCRLPGMPAFCLVISGVLYAPVLIEHSNLLLNPREIYAATRSGFGIEFFLSTFFVYFGFILLLFSKSRGWISVVLYCVVALLVIYMHGSKGQLLAFGLIALYYAVFVGRKRFPLFQAATLAIVVTVVVMVLFYLTFPADMRKEFLISIASYSDYTRNSLLVIDDDTLDPQFGRLTFENSVYSLVPRALFPDKPHDFGSLWLVQRYFPERFAEQTGAPAFGMGVPYADFGLFAVFYQVGIGLLSGIFMRILTSRLAVIPDVGTFILLLVFLEVPLIPTGAGAPLVVYYLLAHLARLLQSGPGPSRNEDGSALSLHHSPQASFS